MKNLESMKKLFKRLSVSLGFIRNDTEDVPEYIKLEQQRKDRIFEMIDQGLIEFDHRGSGSLRVTRKGIQHLVEKNYKK